MAKAKIDDEEWTLMLERVKALEMEAGPMRVPVIHYSLHCSKCATHWGMFHKAAGTASDVERYIAGTVPKCVKCGGVVNWEKVR